MQSIRQQTNLDRTVIDKEAVEGLEGLASTLRLVENDIGNAARLRVRAVRKFNLLDRAYRLNKVFLGEKKRVVSEPTMVVDSCRANSQS